MADNAIQGPWASDPWATANTRTADDIAPLSATTLNRDPPRRDWMVEDFFLRGTVALVSGEGGVGKSLLMQQLATAAALGRPWLGQHVSAGRALVFACEDDGDELHRRQCRINAATGFEMDDVIEGGLFLVPRVGQQNALIEFARFTREPQPTPLFNRLTAFCRRNGVQYVFLDTATHCFRGNQNDEMQVTDFISQLRRLAIGIQGTVILTKHPSLTGRALGTGESGSVTWQNSVRSRVYLHKDKAGQLLLETMKSNYAASGGQIPLKWANGAYTVDAPAASAHTYADPNGYD